MDASKLAARLRELGFRVDQCGRRGTQMRVSHRSPTASNGGVHVPVNVELRAGRPYWHWGPATPKAVDGEVDAAAAFIADRASVAAHDIHNSSA